MKNTTAYEKNAVIGLFAKTADNLISAVDAEILSCEFSDAENATIRMQETLSGIVVAMLKRKHCTLSEAAMIKNFINCIAADKKKIISNKRYIRSLEYQVNNDTFKAEKEKWKEYTTPSEESNQMDSESHHNIHRWEPDDDEEDL